MNDQPTRLVADAPPDPAAPLPTRQSPLPLPAPRMDQRVRVIREAMIDRIWNGLLIIALLGVPASASRAFTTGWLDLYTAHVIIGTLVCAIWAGRHYLSFHAKVMLLMLMFWAVGLVGLFNLGLLGAGVWWLVTSGLLISTLYSTRVGMVVVGIGLIAVMLAGQGFVNGSLALQIDANAYMRSPAAWLTLLIATAVMPFIVFQAVAGLQSTTIELLEQTELQRLLIEHMATHDRLTGLPTMNLAADRLKQALLHIPRKRRKVGLLFIDLDGFKANNDRYGHEAGDELLKAVGARLLTCVRAEDTIARIGGDEFIAVLEDLAEPADAVLVAEQVIKAVAAPVAYDGNELGVGASIGVAIAPDHGSRAKALMRAADSAMYRAKRAGKNCAVLSDATETE